MRKRLFATILILAAVISLVGCGTAASPSTGTSSGTTTQGSAAQTTAGTTTSQPATVTPQRVTLYPYNAGLQSGPASGWVDKFFRENGIILEVIPFSDEKTQAMLASGDLPDVVVFNSATNAVAAIEAGMLLPLDDHLNKLPSIVNDELYSPALKYSRELYSDGSGKLYIIPWGVGNNTIAALSDSERYAIKLKFDVYEQIGAPSFDKLEDIIPILKQMQQAYPKNEEGTTVYGMHLFSDFDTTENNLIWFFAVA